MFNLNINAEEFVPSESSPYMIETKWFDSLEQNFVEKNDWLFDYCPLENVIKMQNDEMKKNEIDKDVDDEYYKYKENKFKKNVFKPKLETISEEKQVLTYAECLKK